jgi:hypothetical protein
LSNANREDINHHHRRVSPDVQTHLDYSPAEERDQLVPSIPAAQQKPDPHLQGGRALALGATARINTEIGETMRLHPQLKPIIDAITKDNPSLRLVTKPDPTHPLLESGGNGKPIAMLKGVSKFRKGGT